MKIALIVCVIFCSILLASTKPPKKVLPPLPPWLRVYLGLNYIFKDDVDLVHVVVSTTSLQNFRKAKRAAKLLTKAVDVLSPIDEWGSQIGFIQVSSPQETRMEFRLGKFDNLAENLNAIDDVAFSSGSPPAIGKGLKYARKMIGTFASTDNQVVVLVTNTRQNIGQDDPIEEADKLKANGVRVCVVCIGQPNKWVERIASGKCYQCYPTYRAYLRTVKKAVKKIVENNQE